MKNQQISHVLTNFLLVTVFILILGGVLFALTSSATANEAGNTTTTAAVGNSITYQGELNNSGNPVNDTCDMKFQLYDAASGGSSTSSELNQSVTVSEGIFTVELDFGSSAFTGDARYLNIAVKCSSDGGYTTMGSRVALNATPYALSLRPGAMITGSVASGSSLSVANETSSGKAYGIYGVSNSAHFNGIGVFGESTASSGATKGVFGQTASSDYGATGVFGHSTAPNGEVFGVLGQTTSSEGIGVYGLGTMTGTYGLANSNSGVTYGVYGESRSSSGYGVYSEGNAHINGNLTWKPITSYLSIPAAAFIPVSNDTIFTHTGHTLTPGNSSSKSFLAPVQLPHGADVTNLTYYWTDNDATYDSTAFLYRIDLAGGEAQFASAGSSGSAGTGSGEATYFVTHTIDNSQYGYYVWLDFGSVDMSAHGVVIEYTVNQPH